MKINISEWMIQIGITVIVLCIIALITLVMLSSLSPSSLCENICHQQNGTYWIMSDCEANDTWACAGFCVIRNQTIFCKQILDNITTAT